MLQAPAMRSRNCPHSSSTASATLPIRVGEQEAVDSPISRGGRLGPGVGESLEGSSVQSVVPLSSRRVRRVAARARPTGPRSDAPANPQDRRLRGGVRLRPAPLRPRRPRLRADGRFRADPLSRAALAERRRPSLRDRRPRACLPAGGVRPRGVPVDARPLRRPAAHRGDRKSTRLNSSHLVISYAVFCLKKKKKTNIRFYNKKKKKKKHINNKEQNKK